VRCQSGCCAINARTAIKSSAESLRPWRQIGSTGPTIYTIRKSESSEKCPNSRARFARLLFKLSLMVTDKVFTLFFTQQTSTDAFQRGDSRA